MFSQCCLFKHLYSYYYYYYSRKYKYSDLNDLPPTILFVVNLLKTTRMFQFFQDCTGLEFLAGKLNMKSYY